MLVLWMLYAILVSGIFGVVGLWLDRLVRKTGATTRWVWALGILFSVVIPLQIASPAPWNRSQELSADPSASASSALQVFPLSDQAAIDQHVSAPMFAVWLDRLDSLNRPASWLWVATSTLGLILFGTFLAYIANLKKSWKPARLVGQDVLISSKIGPAVVGAVKTAIVLPSWILSFTRLDQRLIVSHETEHLRARDPLLLFIANTLTLLFFWNPILWWKLARLKLAIELDCDRRVLSLPSTDPLRYGELLLEVGCRKSIPVFSLPGFSSRSTSLETRIRSLLEFGSVGNPRRPVASLTLGVLLVALVGFIPAPNLSLDLALGSGEGPAESITNQMDSTQTRPKPEEERITLPFVVSDLELLNRDRIWGLLNLEADRLLRDGATGGSGVVALTVGMDGGVLNSEIFQSSGDSVVDAALLRVGLEARYDLPVGDAAEPSNVIFLPLSIEQAADPEVASRTEDTVNSGVTSGGRSSTNFGSASAVDSESSLTSFAARGRHTPMFEWLQNAARLIERSGLRPEVAEAKPLDLAEPDGLKVPIQAPDLNESRPSLDLGDLPDDLDLGAVPYSVMPVLMNPAEVRRYLERIYPRQLQNRGIGGDVIVRSYVNDRGKIGHTTVSQSSGRPSLDEAAIRVAQRMRFAPGKHGDLSVGLWVEIPISFTVR